jgi:hypothetical protein
MEPKTRNVVVAVIILCLVACCCLLTVGGVLAGNWLIRTRELGVGWGEEWRLVEDQSAVSPERFAETFEVGEMPTIEVDNFAGTITVRVGESGTVQVSALKKAPTARRLSAIQLRMDQNANAVTIKTQVSVSTGTTSVDLEITVPRNSHLVLHTGAGTIDLSGIQGPLDLSTGAGTIEVRDAQGTVHAETGAGNIDYEGAPAGESRLHTGAGSIAIALPRDANLSVDLQTGLGMIDAQIDVDGQVSARQVTGIIGTGIDGTLTANTGVGTISLRYR